MDLHSITKIQDVELLHKIIKELIEQNKISTEQNINSMNDKLNQHSQNSQKPPSSNPYKKEANRTTIIFHLKK